MRISAALYINRKVRSGLMGNIPIALGAQKRKLIESYNFHVDVETKYPVRTYRLSRDM